MDEKVLTAKDLKDRFVRLGEEGKKAQNELGQMQNALQSKQVNLNHIQGAMQDTAELMVQVMGEDAVKAFIADLNKPQEEKKDSK